MMNKNQLLKTTKEIRERMMKHKPAHIASASGLSVPTVRAFMNGVDYNASIFTISKIADTLDSMEGVEND